MVDFHQSYSKNLSCTNIVDNDLLQFVVQNVSIDGEVLKSTQIDKNGKPIYRTPYYMSNYNNLNIIYTSNGNYKISGSIHKFWDQKNYNCNDFTVQDCKKAIIKIRDTFGINLKDCKLQVFEIGVNIEPSMDVNMILENCFLHKTKSFESKHDSKRGKYIVCSHSQYQVILYNKSLQMKSNRIHTTKNILRFEIRYTKMEKLNDLGLIHTNDLLNFDFRHFKKLLLEAWSNILFYEPFLDKKNYYDKYSNPLFWKELISRDSKSAYNKHKNKFIKKVQNSSDNTKDKITQLIEAKINFLIEGV